MPDREIIFYDGECGLCHFWVRFVLKHDQEERFYFSPLQSKLGSEILDEAGKNFHNSVLLKREGSENVLARSDAVSEIMIGCGGMWGALGKILRLIPRPLRETGYRMVAAVRGFVFSKPEQSCPIVPPHQQDRFLFD